MRLSMLTAALLASPAAAGAQLLDDRPRGPEKGAIGVSLVVAQPLGAFRDYVKVGGGIDGSVLVHLTRDRAWGVRIDGGFINYGRETKRTRLSNSIGDRIRVDVNTTNNIARMGVGPQLTVPRGPVRPYLHGTIGFSYFYTQSGVEGVDDTDNEFASTTNFSDAALSWGGGGGLLFPFKTKGTTVAVDFGARYLKNGRTRYLREGGITDNPDGTIDVSPIESEVELLVWNLGVSIGLR